MAEQIKVEVKEAILDSNDKIALETNQELTRAGIFAVNVMGAPGVGKTSTIVSVIEKLPDVKSYVLEGDIESDLDTASLKKLGIDTIQINTHGSCHLDAPVIAQSVKGFDTSKSGMLFIENIGNLVCPAEFIIGEHIKMLIVSVTDGSDKPYKYPLAFEKADVIIINKADLIPYVDFDEKFFLAGVRALNKKAPLYYVSCKEKSGYEEVAQWLKEAMKKQLP